MNKNQENFLTGYLRTGNKVAAYKSAYPNAQASSVKSAVNRLLRDNPVIEQTVSRKRWELRKEAIAEAKEQIAFEELSKREALHLLACTARGTREIEKVWHTKDGFKVYPVKPTHSQSVSAIRQYGLLEGWHVQKALTTVPKPKAEEQPPNEKVRFRVMIGGLPLDDYTELYNERSAYYDKEDTPFADPDNNHFHDRFMEVQKLREQRRDAVRDARMTTALKAEEQQALSAFALRPVEESLYRSHKDVIQCLVKEYLENKDAQVLEECSAVKALCGLRFLHHRHRYEAEHTAGWEFHPFNNQLIRRRGNSKFQEPNSNQGRYPEHSEGYPEVTGEPQSMVSTSDSQFKQSSIESGGQRVNTQNREQPATTQGSSLPPLKRQQPATNRKNDNTQTPNHQSQIIHHKLNNESAKAAALQAIKTGKLPPDIDFWELQLALDPTYFPRYKNMIDIKEKLFRALPRKTQWGIVSGQWNSLHGPRLERDKNGRVTW